MEGWKERRGARNSKPFTGGLKGWEKAACSHLALCLEKSKQACASQNQQGTFSTWSKRVIRPRRQEVLRSQEIGGSAHLPKTSTRAATRSSRSLEAGAALRRPPQHAPLARAVGSAQTPDTAGSGDCGGATAGLQRKLGDTAVSAAGTAPQ